jgi:uncharacterized protein
MVYLLDVNVLIALLDADHEHHERAHIWFGGLQAERWATCPITENGVVRILAQTTLGGGRLGVAEAAQRLERACQLPNHLFWPDDISLLDKNFINYLQIPGPKNITDAYLLGIAVKHGGRLATFDRRLVTKAVKGGVAMLSVIE